MKVFVSWSGARSKAVANALRLWLTDLFPDVHVWMSEHDIDAGTRWGSELNSELESSSYGILCLTAENLSAPWLLFEAGSLAKAVSSARVVPYRLGVRPTDVSGPLAQFQGVDTSAAGTMRLIRSINEFRDNSFSDERLQRVFEKWWPDLELQLTRVPAVEGIAAAPRPDRAILEEILQSVRDLSRSKVREATNPAKATATPMVDEALMKAPVGDLIQGLREAIDRWKVTSHLGEELYLEQRIDRFNAELRRRGLDDQQLKI